MALWRNGVLGDHAVAGDGGRSANHWQEGLALLSGIGGGQAGSFRNAPWRAAERALYSR